MYISRSILVLLCFIAFITACGSQLTCNFTNCAVCMSNVTCMQCVDGYTLNQNQTECISCGSNCSVCSIPYCLSCNGRKIGVCLYCVTPFYFVSPNGTCIVCTVPYCQSCNETNTCYACQNLFTLANNTCTYCNVTNCQTCESARNCSICMNGYQLVNNTCLPGVCAINNCSYCSSNNTCSICQSIFTLYQNQCMSCNISNCMTCSTADICTRCVQLMKLQNNSCIPCAVTDCSICNSTDQCIQCAGGYNLNNGYCVPNCPQNCTDCNVDTGACAQCPQNFTLYGSNCYVCAVANCQVCSSANKCNQCFSGFIFNNQSNQCECGNSQLNSNCQCPINFTIFQSNCVNNCGIQNCANCSGGACLQCLSTFKLIGDSVCQLFCPIQDCSICQVPNVCSACSSNLSPTKDGTSCVNCTLQNCAYCSSDNTCGLCSPGYFLLGWHCILCNIEYCESCQLANTCQYCYFPYSPSADALSCLVCLYPCTYCNNNGLCLTCDRPFSLTPTSSGICFLCSDVNCESCSQDQPNICLSCLRNYQNINGMCQSYCGDGCSYCIGENHNVCGSCPIYYYYNSYGRCSPCDNQQVCLRCSPANPSVCLQCTEKFYLSGNDCVSCPIYCSSCTSSTNCQTTIFPYGYTLVTSNNQSELAVCDSGCLHCIANNPSSCYQCLPGFYLVDSNIGFTYCQPCASNCQACNNSQCFNCFPGSYFSNYGCQMCSQSCITCAESPTNCTSCQFGYTLQSDNTCGSSYDSSCDQNCAICIENGFYFCQSCNIGYALQNSNCLPCQQGCSSCSSEMITQCFMCSPTYYLQAGTCYTCDYNCLSCSSFSNCLSCLPGYILTSNFICISQCAFPCSTCALDDSYACLSCVAGYLFQQSSNSCNPDLSCSETGTCIACPAGSLFYYQSESSQICVACSSSLSACQRCNPEDTSQCLLCMQGYFLNDFDNNCVHCPFNCSTCYNYNYCMSCASTYVAARSFVPPEIMLMPGYFSGIYSQPIICIKCFYPCRSCYYSPSFCTSCQIKFYLSNNECVSNFNYFISLTMTPANSSFFMQNYYNLIYNISQTAGVFINFTTVQLIAFTSSQVSLNLIISTVFAAGSDNAIQQEADLTALISGDSIAGIPLVYSLLLTSGGSNSNTSHANTLGIIVSCSIAGGVVLAIVIIFIVRTCMQKRKKRSTQNQNQPLNENSIAIERNKEVEISYLSPEY